MKCNTPHLDPLPSSDEGRGNPAASVRRAPVCDCERRARFPLPFGCLFSVVAQASLPVARSPGILAWALAAGWKPALPHSLEGCATTLNRYPFGRGEDQGEGLRRKTFVAGPDRNAAGFRMSLLTSAATSFVVRENTPQPDSQCSIALRTAMLSESSGIGRGFPQ